MSERRADQAWVFWDGTCGFCRRAVDWIKRQDRHDRLFPVPYQVAPRPPMTEALARRCAHAIHVLTPEGVALSAGRASLYLMDAVGWRRFSAVFSTQNRRHPTATVLGRLLDPSPDLARGGGVS